MSKIFSHFLTGNKLIGGWYIPFIMLIFFLSPIFILFERLNLYTQIVLIILSLACSLLIHAGKQGDNMFLIQNLIYYSPFFLIGISVANHEEKTLKLLNSILPYLIIMFFVILYIQYKANVIGNYRKSIFSFQGIDIMLLNKVILNFILFTVLNKIKNIEFRLLKVIGSYSFGIFFIHGFFIMGLKTLKQSNYIDLEYMGWSFFAISIILITASSIMSINLTIRFLGKRSRYLIGV